MKQPELQLRERDVSRQIRDFLSFRGWRVLRNNVGGTRDQTGNYVPFGEPGMADLLALYYFPKDQPGAAASLWVEVKQAGARLRPNQVTWHAAELARGAIVVVADDFEKFHDWYWSEMAWVHSTQLGQGHLFQQAAP